MEVARTFCSACIGAYNDKTITYNAGSQWLENVRESPTTPHSTAHACCVRDAARWPNELKLTRLELASTKLQMVPRPQALDS